ncbi:hypothetical protein G7Y89_g12596 [Cudoniella acicularis]|uniref:Aminoglycoside phosphotransferase domain-containing protein n=1 Tax=Cudoniella acicularis TaxID=354080 RepID=A0A8H4VX78_9HELO|nr:hypothetical protein G7Y89_g12596 [Cudoniella acicularis]
MAPTDPHQGGDLFDMAKDGTSIPNDAGKMRIIPSVPRPGEGEGQANANRSALADAASNPTHIPRSVQDIGAGGEVETGTGDQLPAAIESKRLHYGANEPLSKGHDRYDKHSRQRRVILREGLNNKAYLLTMDNSAEVFAKLPNPLWQDWDGWSIKDRFTIIEQVVEIERKLASTKFTKSGRVYFRKDIPNSDALVTSYRYAHQYLSVSLWGHSSKGGCGAAKRPAWILIVDHGPQGFVETITKNETKFIKAHARLRMNYARSLTEPESPDEMLVFLDRYLLLAQAMVPPQSPDDTHSPTLWHLDLHLDNVFVDAEAKQITRVIDWQSAAVLPFFYQCGVATMFKHQGPVSDDMTLWPKCPENYHSLEQDEKEKIDNLIRSECLHKYYLAITHNKNRRHWVALQLHEEVRTQPTRIAQSVWKDRDVFFLRRALVRIVNGWEDLCPDSSACPVRLSEKEIALHTHEEENRGHVSEILTLFRNNWGLPPNGSIESAGFNKIRTELSRMRDAFIEAADNEDRLLAEKLWPYQDTMEN